MILPLAPPKDRLAGTGGPRDQGNKGKGLALASALWCRYCYGETEIGKPIPPNDPSWDRLQQAAKTARNDPRAFLQSRHIFGDLANNPNYIRAFSDALSALWARGVRSTLADYLTDKP